MSVLDWPTPYETRIVVNPVVLGELEFGETGVLPLPAGMKRQRQLERFAVGIAWLPVVDIDAAAAAEWATLLADLRRKG